jgi:hypothetical protein
MLIHVVASKQRSQFVLRSLPAGSPDV